METIITSAVANRMHKRLTDGSGGITCPSENQVVRFHQVKFGCNHFNLDV